MEEFVAQKLGKPSRWTWARVSSHGPVIRKTGAAYPTLRAARGNAALYGLDGARDRSRARGLE